MGVSAKGRPFDYAEGTWSPVLSGASTPGTQTYSAQAGWYIRIGNLVTVGFSLSVSAVDGAAAGNAIITGLPFTSSNITNQRHAVALAAIAGVTLTANYTQVLARIQPNAAQIDIQQCGSAQALANVPITGIAAGFLMTGTVTYRIG